MGIWISTLLLRSPEKMHPKSLSFLNPSLHVVHSFYFPSAQLGTWIFEVSDLAGVVSVPLGVSVPLAGAVSVPPAAVAAPSVPLGISAPLAGAVSVPSAAVATPPVPFGKGSALCYFLKWLCIYKCLAD